MRLSEMKIKEVMTIKDMSNLDSSFLHRLMDMGIYPGAEITVVNKMARGKMLVVEVDDVEICIRKIDAERIELI